MAVGHRGIHEKDGHIFLQLWHVRRIGHPALQPGRDVLDSGWSSLLFEAAGGHCMRLRSRKAIYLDPYFLSGIVSGVSLESTTKTANRLAGSLSLAFSLIL